jgi:hypothetical protein
VILNYKEAANSHLLQLEASMCHLRGVLYMRLNRAERAKNCFLEALALDVKCFESFNTLIQSQMLTVEEGETSFTAPKCRWSTLTGSVCRMGADRGLTIPRAEFEGRRVYSVNVYHSTEKGKSIVFEEL